MKRVLFISLLCLLSKDSYSQKYTYPNQTKKVEQKKTTKSVKEKIVVLTLSPQTVPKGKIWVIPTQRKLLVEVSSGTLTSGTICNSYLLSNPNTIGAINEGEYTNPEKGYFLLLKEFKKEPFTNDATLSIVPIGIINTDHNFDNDAGKKAEDIGMKEITFYPGQQVFLSGCLNSLQIFERDSNE